MPKYQLYKLIIYRLFLNILQMIQSFVTAVPLGILGAVITIFILRKYQNQKGKILEKKRNAIVLMVSYIIIMLQMAILFRPWGTISEIDFIPFDTQGGIRYIILYAVANAIIFTPIGILVPVIWEKMGRLKRILLVGFLGSLFIEISQLVLQCGVVQTEDLIMNTLGAGIGYWIYIKKINKYRTVE